VDGDTVLTAPYEAVPLIETRGGEGKKANTIMRKLNVPIFNRPNLNDEEKEPGDNPIPAEELLWKFLQRNQLDGLKFRRQSNIGNYIVNFYCPSAKLVIELDDGIHSNPEVAKKYRKRDEVLQSLDLNVMRVSNKEVFEQTKWVLWKIKEQIKE